MNRVAWIVTLPIALLVILFALMNRQEVSLSLWPLPWDISAPLFLFTLGAIVFGFLFGALVAWLSGGTTRQKLRDTRRELAHSRDELAHARRQQPAAGASSLAPHRSPTVVSPPVISPPVIGS
ncbi:lipopolysaccharide assembly LapA domain-containing protein [Dongia sp.]|uniref:LapA family protein n=1 Tax=Dongia sp. TaxID=1977262 RepID=UPI0035B060B4